MFQPKAAWPPIPTAFLPPLKLLDSLSAASISLALAQLKQLYQPVYTPTSRDHQHLILEFTTDSGYATDDEYNPNDDLLNNDAWEIARSDPLERSYAIRWMTGFVARSEEFMSPGSLSVHEAEDRERIVDAMIAFLSACAQTSESGDLHREFNFFLRADDDLPSREVNVILKDVNLSTTDHTSVGLQVNNFNGRFPKINGF